MPDMQPPRTDDLDPSQPPDSWLVLKAQEGDVPAFEALVGRWQDRLWRHAWRLLGDEEQAWDALQEGWIAIARGLARLHDADAFPAWAYRIVTNKCRDLIRRESRRRHTIQSYLEDLEVTGAARADPPEPGQGETLEAALAALPGPDRAILALRYQEDLDLEDIAHILGVPAGTVKSRLHRARQRLRHTLEEQEHE
jgi:RNA polymerase sigma-70 factor (ECF subfamily)